MPDIITLLGAKQSLRRNLLKNIFAAVVVCLVVLSGIVAYEITEHTAEDLHDTLSLEAQELGTKLEPSLPAFGLDAGDLRFQGPHGRYRYTVFDHHLQPIIGGEDSNQIREDLAILDLDDPAIIFLPDERIAVGLKAQAGEEIVHVFVSTHVPGLDSSLVSNVFFELGEQLLWLVLGIISILSSVYYATRRTLTSLDNTVEQAESIGPESFEKRLNADRLPTELKPLIMSINDALSRLETGYLAQRDFASNAAHEVRTPLAVLRSSLEQIDDPTLRSLLCEDADGLSRLFEQLVDLARADSLDNSLFVPVDLHDLAVAQARDMAPQAIRAGKAIGVYGAKKCIVQGNAASLSIAIANLIRNALAYSKEGSEVEIHIMAAPPGVEVFDYGHGVPDDQKDKLFERFNRGKPNANKPSGSGIGLAIVKSVAQAHGATVHVRDRQSGGSIFSFSFDNLL